MRNQFNEIMQKLRAQRVRARRYTAMLLVLAMLTSLSVSWRLHQVGTALTTDNEYCCGMEEHVHTDDCYTEELVCGYEEGQPEDPDSAFSVDSEPTTEEPEAEPEEPEPEETEPEVHHHTADCYETVLVEHEELTCGEEEHTHDETCPVDPDTGDFLCGFEEHTHTDDCFTTETETEEKLVCGYEEGQVISDGTAAEDGIAALEDTNTATSVAEDSSEAVSEPVLHHHTEACYEKVLTCTIPEHTHTLACLADYSADVETDDDWEKYSVGLSDNWNEALLAVAKEQLGYKESEKNFQTDEALGDIIDVHHYTRYGAFYGNPYADWDVAFIAFCQHYAGIPKTEIPQRLGLEALRADMDAMGFAYLTEGEDAAYEAIPGDVVTYNKNGTADDETIGIVETVGDDSLTVISGAVEGAVAEVTVPFTDVTSTILVDQAYGDYVGEADDRDADYDDEIALQPADEVGAMAVASASEDDIFNIDSPALNLDDSTVQNNLGLTFTLENKPDGKNWEKIPAGSTIQEGDEVRLVLHMGSVPKDTFSDATNGNKAYYRLPYKLAEPVTANIYDENDSTKVIGHLNVNTEGLAVITFDKVQGFDYKDPFTATINVSGKIVASDTGASEDFSLSDGTHFILKKNSDIKTEKSAAAEVVEKGNKTYFKYTVKVSSKNGTAGQPVTIEDTITSIWNLTGKYADQSNFELTKKDGTKVDLTGKLTFASDGKSFKIENLDALGKDDYYELTYLYEVGHSGEYDNKWGNVKNTATATSGENTSSDYEEKSLSREDITVEKTGVIAGGGNDQAVGKITWTVTINNPNGRDLKDYVVDDALKTSGITIREGDKVKIEESTDSYNFHDFKVAGEKQYGTINAQHTGFTYTFPEGSTGKKYRFTYYTTMPNGTDGTKDVINGVDVKKGEKTYHAEGTVQNAVREKKLLKDSSGKLETVSPGKMQEKKWNIAVRTDASVGKKSSFTVTDTFQKPTIGGAEATGLKHYAVKSTLEQELKDSIKFYWVSGENSGKASYSDLTKSEFGGVKINIAYYKADGHEATEDTDEVTSFKITVDWTGATDANLVITQLNAESYSSYVEDVSSLNAGETLTVTNQIAYGGDHKEATSSYTKPKAGNPQLVKRASGDVYSGFNESASVEYGNVIWFKLILKNMTDDTVTVTDTLPEGLKFDPSDNTIGNGSPYYVGFSKNDGGGIDTSCLVPFDGSTGSNIVSRQGVGYLTVSAADYEKGKKQQVTFELRDLNKAQVNNTNGKPIAIIFGVRVDDDRWDDIDFTQDTYTNTAKWDKEVKAKTADVTVKRTNFGLWKTAQQSSDKNAATYTVYINKDSKQWLSTPGSELELHDTLTIPAQIDAEINRQSVKLEKYVNWQWVDAKTDLLRFTLEPMQTDGTNKVYKMTFAVPDGCYYRLTYEYRFLVGNQYGNQTFQISNKVDMFGHGETNSDYWYNYQEGGGTASQTNTNTLQLFKVERNKYNNTLPGATFKLTHWNGSKWSEADGNYTTDAKGQILFRYAKSVDAGVVQVERGVLYKLEETTAPEGYICDNTHHYFLMLSANQTKEDAYAAVSNAEVAEANIRFVAANKTELMHVENTAKQITIRKVWQDANGKQENGSHEPITVKITRYKDGKVDTAWLPKSITLSSDNSWTYIYPDSSNGDAPLEDGYTYAVEETNKPDNYNVSYTDQNGNEQHTGFTSGDTVVIKNMQKSGWLKVEKKWLAEDGKTALKDADLPDGTAITLKLYKVGEVEPVKTQTLTKDDGNNWKWTFTGLNENAQYYVVEDPQVAGFKVTYSHTDLNAAPTGSTVTVTNTKKRTETTLDVVKKWKDSDGNPLTENLPDKITLVLYEKGTPNVEKVRVEVTPDADGNWKHTFTGLEPEKEYYVEEVSVVGYEVVSGTGEGNAALPGATITVINRKNAPGYELPATGSTGTAPYTTAGAVLMGAALVGGYRRKRRQERRGE